MTFHLTNNPSAPLFAEVYNPYIKLTELVGCPDVGDTIAVEHWFFEYFYGMSIADREEILAAFDRDGYYETFEDGCIVTIFPQTDNEMLEDSIFAIQDSMNDYCAHVAANFRKDSIV